MTGALSGVAKRLYPAPAPAMEASSDLAMPPVPKGMVTVHSSLSSNGDVYARLLAQKGHLVPQLNWTPYGQRFELFVRTTAGWKLMKSVSHSQADMSNVQIFEDPGSPALVPWTWMDWSHGDGTNQLDVFRVSSRKPIEEIYHVAMDNAVILPYGTQSLIMEPISLGMGSPLVVTFHSGRITVKSPTSTPVAQPGQMLIDVHTHAVQHHPDVIVISNLPSHLSLRLHQDIVLTETGDEVELGADLDRKFGDPGGFYHFEPAPYRNCVVLRTMERGEGNLVIGTTPSSYFLIHGKKVQWISIPVTIS
ncbi:hypothetical protein SAMN05421799_11522 [Alicyclobacillus vulcanalis]|uniref:Uncharacterized protein n=1 Tax=Alicyclobacillus vulcanalis TaxID=252246 RepID=A0A1N7PN56_9BACL|nr:hypothetical protein SAMN05421799_11522 [Alicyclobacillus vulcanalis]